MPLASGTFSTTLRSRPEWASVIPILLQRQHRDWKESKPEVHDIAIPIPGVGTIASDGHLRFLFLSAVDIIPSNQAKTLQRIERLSYQDGGHRCAIIFLLSVNPTIDDGMTAFASLQILLLTSTLTIPILPLPAIAGLPALLEEFHSKLTSPISINPFQLSDQKAKLEAQQLLPYTGLNPPLPNRAVNVLGDINNSLGDLVDKVSTPQGRGILADYLDGVEGRVVGFWMQGGRM
ncbi:hypothetical protein DL546_000381 [Coniochaeta pulveracea]|uniref:Uncharacterized protein n=1 Tax=Coniochaeta pulveracea TaxID=177199 RepID=A0A420XX56_9PEZI|nr:hypothetical protein DL546_000381 [Coniochaeta pulveracea]